MSTVSSMYLMFWNSCPIDLNTSSIDIDIIIIISGYRLKSNGERTHTWCLPYYYKFVYLSLFIKYITVVQRDNDLVPITVSNVLQGWPEVGKQDIVNFKVALFDYLLVDGFLYAPQCPTERSPLPNKMSSVSNADFNIRKYKDENYTIPRAGFHKEFYVG